MKGFTQVKSILSRGYSLGLQFQLGITAIAGTDHLYLSARLVLNSVFLIMGTQLVTRERAKCIREFIILRLVQIQPVLPTFDYHKLQTEGLFSLIRQFRIINNAIPWELRSRFSQMRLATQSPEVSPSLA